MFLLSYFLQTRDLVSYKEYESGLYVDDGILYADRSGFDPEVLRPLENVYDFSNLQEGKNYSFSDLSETQKIALVLSLSDNTGRPNSDNLEFLAPRSNEVVDFVMLLGGDTDQILANLFEKIFSGLFDQIKEAYRTPSDTGDLETEINFYIQYSKIPAIRSLKITGDIRMEIIKATGESAFITEQ